ncbi:hypothetical protein F4823DRAFT_629041 [Ustulina deusta]|nr:hypothetical protein F4823DRAFT_629041 [Ustulina deusta]
MSEPAYVVMPVRADGSPSQQNERQVAAAIQESLHEKIHTTEHDQDPKPDPEARPEQDGGPLKRVMSNSDSLYKYISWKDPIRTIVSYFWLLGLMYGIHYFHWTQWLLKMGATSLGAVYLASLVSRSTKSDFVARIRPEYRRVPESTLNATLRDIHDLVQYLAIQAQKIMYGEELGKTLGAFVGFTTLFWLIKIMSPFNLAVLGLSSAYIAPLIVSPGGRDIAQCAKVNAQELAHTTAESTKVVLQDTKAKAGDLSCKAQQAAGNFTSKTQKGASSLSSEARSMAGNLSTKAQHAVMNTWPIKKSPSATPTNGTQQNTANEQPRPEKVAQDGKNTVAEQYDQQHHAQNDSE